jgi:hypothetical protein
VIAVEPGTWIALGAMLISLFVAGVKYVDRLQSKRKEKLELAKKQSHIDVERDSIVVRGAEGALLLMEKTMNASNAECEKRIGELEEENEDLRCDLKEVREELRLVKQELKALTNRVRRVE